MLFPYGSPSCARTVPVSTLGRHARLLFWCPGCQVVPQPIVVKSTDPAEREMDPHPAAAKYLADLPWRKTSLAG